MMFPMFNIIFYIKYPYPFLLHLNSLPPSPPTPPPFYSFLFFALVLALLLQHLWFPILCKTINPNMPRKKSSFLYRVTQEYRENLVKVAKSTCEQYKQSLRKTRQKGMSDIRKNKKGKSQDDAKTVEKMVTTKNDNVNKLLYSTSDINEGQCIFRGSVMIP